MRSKNWLHLTSNESIEKKILKIIRLQFMIYYKSFFCELAHPRGCDTS